jgi:hypothetical protein
MRVVGEPRVLCFATAFGDTLTLLRYGWLRMIGKQSCARRRLVRPGHVKGSHVRRRP